MIAYTEKLGFDVLTTPIAEMDRRTLSQAWFSALHLDVAQERVPLMRAPEKNIDAASSRAAAGYANKERQSCIQNGTREANVHRATVAPIITDRVRLERREPTSVLARRIERALLDNRVRNGTFVLDGMDGRVHLSVRSQHGRIHIVAVCSPLAKEYVAKALQHVRFALSCKGIVFEGSLRSTRASAGGDAL